MKETDLSFAKSRRYVKTDVLQSQWKSLQQNLMNELLSQIPESELKEKISVSLGNADLLFGECLSRVAQYQEELTNFALSERVSSQLLTASSIGILALSLEGRIERINGTAAQYWLETAPRMKRRDIFDFIVPEDHRRLMRALRRSVQKQTRIQVRAIRKNGDTFWLSVEARSVPDMKLGRLIVCSLSDVTSTRLLEETVRKMSVGLSPCTGVEFLDQLVQYIARLPEMSGSFVANVVDDSDTCFVVSATTDKKLLGITFELTLSDGENDNKGDSFHSPPQTQPALPGQVIALLGSRYHAAVRVVDSLGRVQGLVYALSHRPVEKIRMYHSILEIISSRLSAELSRMKEELEVERRKSELEREVGLRAVELELKNANLEEEISQRAKVERALRLSKEEAEQASKAKTAFLANMSHEIRTPLNGIVGFSSLLQGLSDSPEQAAFVSGIQECSQSLLRLINDILDFSKMEADQLDLNLEYFNARNWLHSVCVVHSMAATKKGLWFFLDYPPDFPELIHSEPVRLKQIVDNLLSNAVKFTKTGFVRLSASLQRYPSPQLCFSVSDSGIGVSQDHAEKIFDRFVQADASTTRNYGGTGLGLSICRKLTEILRGEISMESEPGGGTRFFVNIPVQERGVVPWMPLRVGLVSSNQMLTEVVERVFSPSAVEVLNGGERRQGASAREPSSASSEIGVLLIDESQLNEFLADQERLSELKGMGSLQRVVLFTLGVLKDVKIRRLADALECSTSMVDCFSLRMLPQELLSTVSGQRGAGRSLIQELDCAVMPKEKTDCHAKKVLIVEDNEVNLVVFTQMMMGFGCDVTQARDGREAIESVGKAKFDIVFMDCLMPVLDGYQAVAQMRERWTDLPPIIAITANALSYDRQKCLDAGFTDYVAKPVRKADLEAILRRYTEPDEPNGSGSKEEEENPPIEVKVGPSEPDVSQGASELS